MRPIAKLAAVCGIAALSSACVVVANPPPQGQPQAQPAAAPAPAAAAQTVAQPTASGRPRNLQAGAAEAFWIWRDDGGWHLRSTTAKVEHRFSGRISGHGKVDITGVHAARNERNDTVKLVDSNITFDFTTAGNADGLDFTIPGNACVDFDLQIDSKAKPDHIVVGADEQRPKSASFTACP